jgi:hypothetical protein
MTWRPREEDYRPLPDNVACRCIYSRPGMCANCGKTQLKEGGVTSIQLGGRRDPCRWCGHLHGVLCPWVKALEFSHGDDLVTRVEFFAPRDYAPTPREEAPQTDYPKYKSSEEA